MNSDPGPITLAEVTQANFDAVIALDVADSQRDFCNSNVESIAWAYVAPECHPLVICEGEAPVGFASYGHVPDERRCWIVHLMVDASRQGQGIGRAALALLLARMDEATGGDRIALAVNPGNTPAIRLYEAFGFTDTGKRQDGELVMLRPGSR